MSTTRAEHVSANGLMGDDLLFATGARTPISRNSFRTHVWVPAVAKSGIDFEVRVHELRYAHASWLLAGGLRREVPDGPHGARPDTDDAEVPGPVLTEPRVVADRLRRAVHRLVRVA